MDVANEILDAIEIIVDKKIREQATQIYSGICKNVNGDSCVMFINGKNNTVQFYGPTPIVGAIYKVFVPYGNMSSAFAITGIVAKSDDEDDKKDLYYSNPNLLDNWYFGNPVNQRGQTSWTNPSNIQYAIDRWQITPSSVIALVDDGITVTAEIQQGLEKNRLELGRTYTFSVLSSDRRLEKHTFVLASDMTTIRVNFGFGIFVCYLSGDNVWIQIYGDGSTYKAVKLELGTQQTLAHQDVDGNWVLNEIPDYGEQLRRCQRYFVNFNPYKMKWFAMPPAVASNATDAYSAVTLPVAMRAQPTVSYDGKIALSQTGDVQVTGIQVSGNTFAGNYLQLRYSVADGLTASSTYRVQVYNDPTSYIWLSADL